MHRASQRQPHGSARRFGAFAVALVAVVGGATFGCANRLPEAPDSPTAAVVHGRAITVEEVDDAIKQELFDQRFPSNREALLFDARRETLDGLIDQRLVAEASKKSGLAPEEWIAAQVAETRPVSDEDIDAFWKEYEHRIPKDRPADEVRSDIRAYLEEERGNEIVAELRESSKVRVVLSRPRHDIHPEGTPRGPVDAPITIVEFSDFQCPYCLRASPTVRALLDAYPEEVRIYYRHLPLPNHPRARPAAIASVCAEQQGHFWVYHDALFANPAKLSDADLRDQAETLGLDLDHFDACLNDPEAAARVDADMSAAQAAGVTGTPVFFVNGVRLTGAQPLPAFKRVIDDELNRLKTEEDS